MRTAQAATSRKQQGAHAKHVRVPNLWAGPLAGRCPTARRTRTPVSRVAGRRHDGVSPRDAGRATRPTTETRGDKRRDARGDGSIHLRRRPAELGAFSTDTVWPVRPAFAREAVPERPAEFDARGPAGRPGRARRAGRGDVFRRGPRSSVLGGRMGSGRSVRSSRRTAAQSGAARKDEDRQTSNDDPRHEYHHYREEAHSRPWSTTTSGRVWRWPCPPRCATRRERFQRHNVSSVANERRRRRFPDSRRRNFDGSERGTLGDSRTSSRGVANGVTA